MIRSYVNYPVARASIHIRRDCRHWMQMDDHERFAHVDISSFADAVQALKEVRFAAQAGYNDYRLEIDFGDVDFEKAVLTYLLKQMGARYSRLNRIVPEECSFCLGR